MFRILFIVVLLAVGLMLLKSWQRKQQLKRDQQRDQDNKAQSGAVLKNTRMVRCLHCGLHVPEHEAIAQGGKHFCSLEHAKRYLTKD